MTVTAPPSTSLLTVSCFTPTAPGVINRTVSEWLRHQGRLRSVAVVAAKLSSLSPQQKKEMFLETREFSDQHDNVQEKRKEITIPTVRLKNLDEVEALISELQHVARLTWGPREMAMGTPSMHLMRLTRLLGVADRPDRDRFASITMAGNIEVYERSELIGFIEVREGGGYVEI